MLPKCFNPTIPNVPRHKSTGRTYSLLKENLSHTTITIHLFGGYEYVLRCYLALHNILELISRFVARQHQNRLLRSLTDPRSLAAPKFLHSRHGLINFSRFTLSVAGPFLFCH